MDTPKAPQPQVFERRVPAFDTENFEDWSPSDTKPSTASPTPTPLSRKGATATTVPTAGAGETRRGASAASNGEHKTSHSSSPCLGLVQQQSPTALQLPLLAATTPMAAATSGETTVHNNEILNGPTAAGAAQAVGSHCTANAHPDDSDRSTSPSSALRSVNAANMVDEPSMSTTNTTTTSNSGNVVSSMKESPSPSPLLPEQSHVAPPPPGPSPAAIPCPPENVAVEELSNGNHVEAANVDNSRGNGSSINHDGRVKVLCRFRGFLDRDSEWAARRSGWLSFDAGGGGGGEHGEAPETVSVRLGSAWSRRGFDKVFRPGVGQAEVYQQVEHVAHGVAQGYNGTLFAYGQTGSGKTYTMGGSATTLSFAAPSPAAASLNTSTAVASSAPPAPSESSCVSPASLMMPPPPPPPPKLAQIASSPTILGGGRTGGGLVSSNTTSLGCEAGVIPRAVSSMLADANARKKQGWGFVLTATYVEIYNERIRDLLDPSNDNLKVIEHPGRGVEAAGAREVRVSTLEEAIGVLRDGAKYRMTAATLMNQASSRSHSIFMLRLDQRDVVRDCKVSGRLTLVDLAGSERAGKTGAEGRRLEEANSINVSLHTLGRVIRALSESAPHVPFRDSKLTRLLQESLGGNSRTVLVICCSPEEAHAQETLSTLKFGECAKRVTTFASANVVAAPDEVAAQLSELRAEVVRLKRQLHDLQLREARRMETTSSAGRGSRRSTLVAGGRVTGAHGPHRKGGGSPLSRAVSFNASFAASDLVVSSGDESWPGTAPRGWEHDASSWTGMAVDVPSPSTPGWKPALLEPRSPLVDTVSPLISPDAAAPSSKGSGKHRRNWSTTPPPPRASSSSCAAKGRRAGGRGRRLWSEGEERDAAAAAGVAAQAPPAWTTATAAAAAASCAEAAAVGVRSGGPVTKMTPAASGNDGVRRLWARREGGGKRGSGSWKREIARQGSLSESGQEGRERGTRTRSASDIPAATAAAAAGAAAAAAAASAAAAAVGAGAATTNRDIVSAGVDAEGNVSLRSRLIQNREGQDPPPYQQQQQQPQQHQREERLQSVGSVILDDPALSPTSLEKPAVGDGDGGGHVVAPVAAVSGVDADGVVLLSPGQEALRELRQPETGLPDGGVGPPPVVAPPLSASSGRRIRAAVAEGAAEGDSGAVRTTDQEGTEGHHLRAALARMQYLENGWNDRAKAYEKLLQLKDLRIESLMSAHRQGLLAGGRHLNDDKEAVSNKNPDDVVTANASTATATAAAATTISPAASPTRAMAKVSPSARHGKKRSPLHGMHGNGGGQGRKEGEAGGRGGGSKRSATKKTVGAGKSRSLSARALSAAPPAPPPSPMRPTEPRPYTLDTDTDDY